MNVGDTLSAKGFFTQAMWLRMQAQETLEDRLGYKRGRLREGWYLLFMVQMPRADQFEVRGYSHMSGGVALGHLPNPPDPRNSEQRLRDGGYDLRRIKESLVRETFTLNGHLRLAKVIPIARASGVDDYPVGSGIPQWTLVTDLNFRCAAVVAPGAMYTGLYG